MEIVQPLHLVFSKENSFIKRKASLSSVEADVEVELKKWLGRVLLPCAVMVAFVGCEEKKKEEKAPPGEPPPVREKITPMQPVTPKNNPSRELQPSYPNSFKPKAQPNVSPAASGTRMEI